MCLISTSSNSLPFAVRTVYKSGILPTSKRLTLSTTFTISNIFTINEWGTISYDYPPTPSPNTFSSHATPSKQSYLSANGPSSLKTFSHNPFVSQGTLHLIRGARTVYRPRLQSVASTTKAAKPWAFPLV